VQRFEFLYVGENRFLARYSVLLQNDVVKFQLGFVLVKEKYLIWKSVEYLGDLVDEIETVGDVLEDVQEVLVAKFAVLQLAHVLRLNVA